MLIINSNDKKIIKKGQNKKNEIKNEGEKVDMRPLFLAKK